MKKPTKWRYEILLELITAHDYKSYVEIGLGHGTTIKYLADNIKDDDFVFYGIDPHEKYDGLHGKGRTHPQSIHERNRREVAEIKSDNRVVLYNEYSHDAVSHFESESIDIVFIDGNHTYEYVLEDAEDWYPIVKRGGILAGHDYYPPGRRHHYRSVGKAVEYFCKKNGLVFIVAPDHVWYINKK